MPITQDRMISLIEAAQAYKSQYENLCSALKHQHFCALQKEISGEQALKVLEELVLLSPIETRHIETMIREQTHFSLRKASNIRARIKQERLRRDKGMPVQLNATQEEYLKDQGLDPRADGLMALNLSIEQAVNKVTYKPFQGASAQLSGLIPLTTNDGEKEVSIIPDEHAAKPEDFLSDDIFK